MSDNDTKFDTSTVPIVGTHHDFGCFVVRTEEGAYNPEYLFRVIPEHGDWTAADEIDGLDGYDGKVVVFEGKNGGSGRYYPSEGSLSEVPVNVAEYVRDETDYVLVEDISAGWVSWGGRPEFDDSVSHVDVSDATRVFGDE